MDERPPSLFQPEVLQRLLQQLEATDIAELEVTVGKTRVFVQREPGRQPLLSVAPEAAEPGLTINAPLTGVFYLHPTPEQPAFVEVGATVVPGQVVGLIETMKLFNEVVADVSGTIEAVLVQEGDLVETGQPLLAVRAEEETA